MGRRCAENKLVIRWDNKEKDFLAFYPTGKRATANYLLDLFDFGEVFGDSVKKELESRGFDTKTFRMEIKRKEEE